MHPVYYYEKLKNRISSQLGQKLIKPRFNDQYLSAYPRSGSTWLRTMLVNLLDSTALGDPEVFNQRFPAVSIRNSKLINSLQSRRFIMTHGFPSSSMQRVVYLVRDGRDTFLSGYYYHSQRAGRDLSLDEYWRLYSNQVFGMRWYQHVNTWLNETSKNRDLITLSYEDLKVDTAHHLAVIADFLSIPFTDKGLESAIRFASLEHARKLEHARNTTSLKAGESFYRSGRAKQWQDSKYGKFIQRFEQEEGQVLVRCGYELRNL